MSLNLGSDLSFFGPALPESFIQHELESVLGKALPSVKDVESAWRLLLKALREPLVNAGAIRVRNVILGALLGSLGYIDVIPADNVRTREGDETGGWLLNSNSNGKLRTWTFEYETDLDAPTKRGLNHRFSPTRIAERVLLATGERLGLLTNGVELRLIFSDPARRASFASFSLSQWKQYHYYDPIPGAFRLLIAFSRPEGQKILGEVIEQARLKQGQVTKDLRLQARRAIEGFVQGVLDHPGNQEKLSNFDRTELACQLWREALIMVYRLLFILRGESGGRETPPFSFVSTSLWRNTYSPSRAQPGNLAWAAQQVCEHGIPTGEFVENGLRILFKAFEHGLETTELHIAPLGGALFGAQSTPLLDTLLWGEYGCALLLDKLLRAPRGKGKGRSLVRISYRDLDVEELGRVYEALLELEPGISSEPMARLRRAKLEVVVPAAQGEKYRPKNNDIEMTNDSNEENTEEPKGDETEEIDEEFGPGKKTKIEWIEAIQPGQFYLHIGLGRKSSGSYYTPESFVKFLVQETLGPQCDERSPNDNPQPLEILKLNVLDPAMGSGHFLVGACRFLGERLYDACRTAAEKNLWERIPEEVAPYLPGRRPEGESEAGFSAERAKALCKRLVAVHCLYGVDKNPLAVELAKVSLWLESFAEGLPLTFLDHRLVCGDSLLGPINFTSEGKDSPFMPPYADTPIDAALTAKARSALREWLGLALEKVHLLDATVGVDEMDLLAKQQAKAELEAALRPFVDLCVAWSGGIMQGVEKADATAYQQAMELVANHNLPEIQDALMTAPEDNDLDKKDLVRQMADCTLPTGFLKMLAKGRASAALIIPLVFPEVFFPSGDISQMSGFDAILGNPPWDQQELSEPEYWAHYDLRAIEARFQRERDKVIAELKKDKSAAMGWEALQQNIKEQFLTSQTLYLYQSVVVDGKQTVGRPDVFRLFAERILSILKKQCRCGLVMPSAFHTNEGVTGIRQLYLLKNELNKCFSFENKQKLFDIDSRFKFDVVVVTKSNKTKSFICGFYLHDDRVLFTENSNLLIEYSIEFVMRTGGNHLTLIECRNTQDQQIINAISKIPTLNWEKICDEWNIQLAFGVEIHRSKEYAVPLLPPQHLNNYWLECVSLGWKRLPICEGKTVWQYQDYWTCPIQLSTPIEIALSKRHWQESFNFYRLGYRRVASSTNERTFVSMIIPPGAVCDNTIAIETTPSKRKNYYALYQMSIGNSYSFDYLLRQRVSATVNAFLIAPIQICVPSENIKFIVHGGLRLVCNHPGFFDLWQEQFGNEWRESIPANTFPVLANEDARWEVRSAIDAVVAQDYGLSREQYAHVLSTFSHKSYPKAPSLCLTKFDELNEIGLEVFTQKHDPYWDVPLVETLPKPVIELPLGETVKSVEAKDLFGNPLQTNLFGEVVMNNPKKGRKSR